MKGLWVNWENRDPDGYYKGFDEIYLATNTCRVKPNLIQLASYITKCRLYSHKVYLSVTCLAGDKPKSLSNIKQEIKEYSYICDGISLDYIRYKNMSWSNPSVDESIKEILDYTKTQCDNIKIAVFPIYNSFLYGQNYFKLQKYGVLQPMLYPQDMFGKTNDLTQKLTRIIIAITQVLFPKSEPCLQAWDEMEKNNFRRKSDLIKDIKFCKNYSIFRHKTYMEMI